MTTSNAKHFIASSLRHNLNRHFFTVAVNDTSSCSLSAEELCAEKIDSTEQYTAPTAAESTKNLIGESFIGVDNERTNKDIILKLVKLC